MDGWMNGYDRCAYMNGSHTHPYALIKILPSSLGIAGGGWEGGGRRERTEIKHNDMVNLVLEIAACCLSSPTTTSPSTILSPLSPSPLPLSLPPLPLRASAAAVDSQKEGCVKDTPALYHGNCARACGRKKKNGERIIIHGWLLP